MKLSQKWWTFFLRWIFFSFAIWLSVLYVHTYPPMDDIKLLHILYKCCFSIIFKRNEFKTKWKTQFPWLGSSIGSIRSVADISDNEEIHLNDCAGRENVAELKESSTDGWGWLIIVQVFERLTEKSWMRAPSPQSTQLPLRWESLRKQVKIQCYSVINYPSTSNRRQKQKNQKFSCLLLILLHWLQFEAWFSWDDENGLIKLCFVGTFAWPDNDDDVRWQWGR